MKCAHTPNAIHVYPTYGRLKSTHLTGKVCDCWCEPEVLQPCPESLDRRDCDPNCYRCAGRGLVLPYDADMALIWVHSDGQRRGPKPKKRK